MFFHMCVKNLKFLWNPPSSFSTIFYGAIFYYNPSPPPNTFISDWSLVVTMVRINVCFFFLSSF